MRSRRSYGAPVAAMGHRLYNFTSGSLPPGATLTRASTGWYFDSAGVLQSAANDVARFTSGGLLVESARTNGIRNASAGGAIAGTPGTLPTSWRYGGTLGVLTGTVVGFGTEDGLPYVDVRLSGTPDATDFHQYEFESRTQVAALAGQQWAASQFVRVVGGSLANVTISRAISEYSSGGSRLNGSLSAITPSAGALAGQRTSLSRTLTEATTAYINSGVRISYTNGLAIDVTLRIGLPQLELGGMSSSPIVTTGSAMTRAADVLSLAMLDGIHDIDITRASGVTNVVGAVVSGGSYTVPTDLSPLQSVIARRVA